MKSVQLLPDKQQVKVEKESNGTGIKGPIIGVLVVAGVGLYFGYTQLDRLETELQAAQAQQASLQDNIAIEESRLEELGRRTDYASVAANAEQMVLASLEKRYPYGAFLRKLTYRLPDGIWLEEISTEEEESLVSDGSSTSSSLSIIGVAPDAKKTAAMKRWIETLPDVVSVELSGVETIETTDRNTRQRFTFTVLIQAQEVVATEVDLPGEDRLTADEVGSAGSNDTGVLALTPEPVRRKKSQPQPEPEPEPETSALEELANSINSSQEGAIS